MPLLRPLAWLLALLLLIVAAIAVFALTFDANRYKPELASLVKEQTGRKLDIDGDIHLSFYPDIALQLGQVKLGNAKGFANELFAEADNARVTVQFLPLLEQQLKINEVHLRGLKLNLHRNKNGKTNWQDLLPENATKANANAGEAMTRLLGGMVITGVSVEDSQLRWRDDQQGKNLTLAPLNLKTGTFNPGKPVDIRIDTLLTQDKPAVTMQLILATTAQLAENQEDFSLADLRLQVKQAERLAANLGGNLQGNLKKERASIPDLQADVTLEGLGKATLSSKLDVNLAKEQLEMNDLSINATVTSAEIPGGQLQQQSSGTLSLNLDSGKGLLDLPNTNINAADQQLTGSLQMRDPLLDSRKIDGKFKTEKLSYPPFTLQQATLGVQFENGQVKLTPTGTLFNGTYQGEINLDTLQTPVALSSEHTVKKLRTDDLLFALTEDRLVTGALDMTAKFDSMVGDEQAFKQNLNGTIDLTLNEGTIRDANFAQKTREVIQLFEKERVNEVGETEVTFTQLKGQWQVKQGVFHTDENVMLAPHFQVKGNGDVNTVNESLDFKLRISEKPKSDKADGLFAPLHIHGAWDKPSYELELDVLLKERAQEEVQSEVDKLEQRLKDELKKKLNGLF